MSDKVYIDVAGGLARVGGNEGLYKRLLGKFAGSVDIDGFNVAITNGDFSGAGEIVHAAKGVAGNLSLTAFFEACATLMDQLRNGGTPDAENVERFRQFFAETKVAVDEYLVTSQA